MSKIIFIEIPTWLGDAVMTTPAIENICKAYPNCKIIIFGSFVSTSIFQKHPSILRIIVDNSKKEGNRYINLYKLAKNVGTIDLAFSFRKNFTTNFLMFFLKTSKKYIYQRYTKKLRHQVIRYNDFINKSLSIETFPDDLKIYLNQTKSDKKLLGINPGATYGNAKRWYPKEFAKVAIAKASEYDIVIFGGLGELDMAKDIENELKKEGITNYRNLAGKTSVEELIENISSLSLFITNDSGPMHVAAAFSIPTVCIFGPTRTKETSQWNNANSTIAKKDYDCMPCMKRECTLSGEENHKCMKNITAQDVLDVL